MDRIRRATTVALIFCLFGQCSPLFASDEASPRLVTPPAAASHLTFNGTPLTDLGPLDADRPAAFQGLQGDAIMTAPESTALTQFGGYRRGGGRRNDAATAALVLGAVGTIAGAAVLVYANRPECSANADLGGCGYGTKVIGGAVLSAGLVGLLIGAITWR